MGFMDLAPDSDVREFTQFSDRERPRVALEGMMVDPATDLITLIRTMRGKRCTRMVTLFQAGNLRNALYHHGVGGIAGIVTVTVTRKGREVFREEGISDLFGVVYF